MLRFFTVAVLSLLAAACSKTPDPADTTVSRADENDTMTDETTADDPYLWLEEVEGEEAISWVEEQNERSLGEITESALYKDNLDKSMTVLTSDERIPYGVIRDGLVYNFWQDTTNVRGLWRRTTLASYAEEAPDWEVVLDFDAFAKQEDKNWVYKGVDCFKPEGRDHSLCLLSLSNGGKDAVVVREFDLGTKQFVDGGFVTPEAKLGTAWVDENTLAIATDWNGDGSTLTESGYPSSVRLWKRGTPLESATPVHAGDKTDVGVWPWAGETADGTRIYGAVEADTFFTRSMLWAAGDELVKIPLPPKSEMGALFGKTQFVTLQQDWDVPDQGTRFKTGDLIAFDFEQFMATRELPMVELVFRANERQAVNGVSVAKDTALLSINDNVASKLLTLSRSDDGWSTTAIDLPGTGQASISFSDKESETVFINYEGFLTPDTLLSYNTSTETLSPLKALPARFDTDALAVQQFEATSKDGTRVPYFIVHREDLPMDGTTPTLLYGYGGFEISLRPTYSGGVGKMWLERGGAYVLANIRGGGEFGPSWHQAGLKGKRQVVYDDFIAIGEDLISRRITSSKHLGIMGGSNGGLLMGVMITQRPDLWNAVVVQVPLLDMLRYHKLLAGASWVDEYGDPDVPEERAFLETISPYQNFDPEADYPMPLFVTSTKDDRVHPGHARKMARKFQAAEKAFLYYENTDGGHSAAANQKARAKRTALEFTYLAEQLFGDNEP
ncbi:MAG: prolyl oligopeptidase family serine peptidase [Pseudomonadota bacterium]